MCYYYMLQHDPYFSFTKWSSAVPTSAGEGSCYRMLLDVFTNLGPSCGCLLIRTIVLGVYLRAADFGNSHILGGSWDLETTYAGLTTLLAKRVTYAAYITPVSEPVRKVGLQAQL